VMERRKTREMEDSDHVGGIMCDFKANLKNESNHEALAPIRLALYVSFSDQLCRLSCTSTSEFLKLFCE
jgi:hypothetical protein